jgi:hypothetical protein
LAGQIVTMIIVIAVMALSTLATRSDRRRFRPV